MYRGSRGQQPYQAPKKISDPAPGDVQPTEGTRMRQFQNPANGHCEYVSPWAHLLAFLFGTIYFAVKGQWRHVVGQLVVIALLLAVFGPPGAIFAFFMWVAYAIMAPRILATTYLRNGWIEVEPGYALDFPPKVAAAPPAPAPAPAPAVASGPGPDERVCPFCAENIKKAAIKCRHCSSIVEPLA